MKATTKYQLSTIFFKKSNITNLTGGTVMQWLARFWVQTPVWPAPFCTLWVLPWSKDMQVRLTGDSELKVGSCECECDRLFVSIRISGIVNGWMDHKFDKCMSAPD